MYYKSYNKINRFIICKSPKSHYNLARLIISLKIKSKFCCSDNNIIVLGFVRRCSIIVYS